MQVLTEGHKYELGGLENPEATQELQFFNTDPEEPGVPQSGTTNEEVLKMLIDRLKYLHGKLPNVQTKEALYHCEDALMLLEARTKDREDRKVEGTHKA